MTNGAEFPLTPTPGDPKLGLWATLRLFASQPILVFLARVAFIVGIGMFGYVIRGFESGWKVDAGLLGRVASIEASLVKLQEAHRDVEERVALAMQTASEAAVTDAALRAELAALQLSRGELARRVADLDRFGSVRTMTKQEELARRIDATERRLDYLERQRSGRPSEQSGRPSFPTQPGPAERPQAGQGPR